MQRRESIGVAVGFGEVSAQLTRFERLQGIDKTLQLAVRPVDAAGNLLGPGNAARVSLKVEGLKPATPVIDLLDGRYLRVYEGREAAITGIRLGVDRTLLKLPHLRIR